MSKFRIVRFYASEPHYMQCPSCGEWMDWYDRQGPMGGWRCPGCGLQIDYK